MWQATPQLEIPSIGSLLHVQVEVRSRFIDQRRIFLAMFDPGTLLNATLEGCYAIERNFVSSSHLPGVR
jgi:hypothetical protein